MAFVCVMSKDNVPLAPTKNFAKVRILVKLGKAKVLTKDPYTIKLLYDPLLEYQAKLELEKLEKE